MESSSKCTSATNGRPIRFSPISDPLFKPRPRVERLGARPLPAAFSVRERRLISRLRSPLAVQRFLNRLPYNNEPRGRATLRSFRGVVRHGCAHCLEAALFAAVVLEQHGYPPLVLSFESIGELEQVICVYWRGDGRGCERWRRCT